MSNANGPEIINNYSDKFFKEHETNPEIIIAVSVICAETTKQAEKIARSTAIWSAYNDTFEFDQIPSYEKAQNYRGSEESEIKIQKALNKRSEEHTSELQSRGHLVCRLLLEK